MDTVDVLVVGAGLAGLNTARLLAQAGLDVAVCERRTSLETGIRTTGIFVRRTLDDYELPHLGPAVRRVLLYPPSHENPVELVSTRDEFRVGDMEGIYAAAVKDAERAGARVSLNSSYPAKSAKARFTIGADGARSTVAKNLGLDVNRQLITGIEEVYPVATGSTPTFHCVVDPRIAPGYIAWVIDDGEHAHIGLAGRADRFSAPLPQLLQRFRDSFPVPEPAGPVKRRGGPIPVGGLLRRIVSPQGLLVGDAAGAVSPLTAGGLDPCLRMSELAASVTFDYLRSGNRYVLEHYDGAAMRRRYLLRSQLRRGLSLVRSPNVAEFAFTMLRTSPGKAVAKRILFN
ncbi:Dehydrogenase (flavoprotein) [Lentzea waywayandensis]|uniref:Dehydrogenase (Flavoprotein) n=1 Tax=Lentzea waywayandensis TaxID=84724 RepID=A0A1I6DNJ6_9PSEU|nr:NAD(P)/FAD-dependent oxidoreductase [Lentzea waywayandensis]SFR06942.1 Dehydrogenase (flavoprotein) [Lentzea waywayandensis]